MPKVERKPDIGTIPRKSRASNVSILLPSKRPWGHKDALPKSPLSILITYSIKIIMRTSTIRLNRNDIENF
jgi:hypothetical protein